MKVNLLCCMISAAVLMAGNCLAGENANKWVFKAGDASIIKVGTGSGAIKINAVKGNSIKAEVIGEYDADKCEILTEIKNGTLYFSAKSKKKRWFWLSLNCKAGFKVTAPAEKKLILSSGSGLMRISDFAKGGKFRSGSGTIEFKNLSGPIDIRKGSGMVKGDIYSEDFNSASGSGILDILWNEAPQKGNVSIKTGSGDTILSFPEETKMGIHYKSGSGDFNSEFGSDLKAGFKIDCKSGSGNLNIRKLPKRPI